MRQTAARVGRDILPAGVVERAGSSARDRCCRLLDRQRPAPAYRLTSQATALTRSCIAFSRAFSAASSAQGSIDFHQRDIETGNARGQRQTGGANAGAEIHDTFTGMPSVAAASRMASWPTR